MFFEENISGFSPHNGLQRKPNCWSPNLCSFKGLWNASKGSARSQLRNRVLSSENCSSCAGLRRARLYVIMLERSHCWT